MLDDRIINKIKEQEELQGIDVSKLPLGCQIVVRTNNNIYKIKTGEDKVWVQGGKYFPEKTECIFNGSTFGGSMLKLNWIGHGMYMEFNFDNKLITTSSVREAKIIGDGWHYNMDWAKNDPK